MVSSDKESKGESAVNQLNLSRTRGSAFSAFGVCVFEERGILRRMVHEFIL